MFSGEVFDVAVDERLGSATTGQWVGETLSAEIGVQLYLPPGLSTGSLWLATTPCSRTSARRPMLPRPTSDGTTQTSGSTGQSTARTSRLETLRRRVLGGLEMAETRLAPAPGESQPRLVPAPR